MEVPGSNSGKVFIQHLLYTFLPRGDCSIRVSRSHNFTFVWFLLYNFVAVTLLLFELSEGTAMMISLSTHQFSSYLFLYSVYPVAVTEVYSFLM